MVWLGEFQSTPQFKVEEVSRDDVFFEREVLPKLTYFYNEVMVKELVDSRKQRNKELREYDPKTNSFI